MKDIEGQLNLFAEPDLEQEYRELVKTLNYHCERYYNDDEPEISEIGRASCRERV